MDNRLFFRDNPTTLQAGDLVIEYLDNGLVGFERMGGRLMIQGANRDDKLSIFLRGTTPIDAAGLAELIAITLGFGTECVQHTERYVSFRFTAILLSQR